MKLTAIVLLGPLLLAAKDVPDWVREAAHQTSKADYPPKATSVVLFREERLLVDADGKRTMTERRATRILQAGPSAPVAVREYDTKAGRIRDFRAWLIFPSGKEIEYSKNSILDVAVNNDKTPYDEERAKVIECDPSAPPGSVFAYEVTEEESTIFTTHPYHFQESEPVLLSRFVLSLPSGWEARGTIFNHDSLQPRVEGSTYTWELRDLPFMAGEEHSPHPASLVPRLGVTYFPASSARPELVPFKDWASVAAWHAISTEPAAEATEPVRAKATELTAHAADEAAKIRAIAAFVQQTNYVSVDLKVMHGGGYAPRPAGQVLARNYGDCKDKVALLRALLKAAGIESYHLAVYATDRRFVRREWPSPMQFNHAIAAVKISPATQFTAVVDHPKLGRLLILDPTDPVSPPGDLPRDEQGSLALLVAPTGGDLIALPQLPPETDRIERNVDLRWNSSGGAEAHVLTRYSGEAGASTRYRVRVGGLDEFKRSLESALAKRLGGVTVDKLAPDDHPDQDNLELAFDIGIQQFGQLVQGRMLIVKPGSLLPEPSYVFPNKERHLPVKLYAGIRRDVVTIKLPSGFAVDELPDPLTVEGPYGTYRATWKTGAGNLTFEQSLQVKDNFAEAAEYPRIKTFFDTVFGGQSAAVVLIKR